MGSIEITCFRTINKFFFVVSPRQPQMTSELQQKQQDFFYSFLKAKVIYSVILSVCLCVFCEAWLVKTVSHYSNDGHFPYLAYGFNILRKEIPIVLVEVEGHVRSPEVIKRKTCKQVVIR